jgi:protein ImuB
LREISSTSNVEHQTPQVTQPRRIHGRPTNDPPRQRRWTHQLWQDGPKDMTMPPAAAPRASADDPSASRLKRAKLFMPDRGTCVTPSFSQAAPARPSRTNEPPLVVTRTMANRQLVIAMSSSAAANGVRRDLTLTEARALCPGLMNFEDDPSADARALEALARWMMRFTPVVALSQENSIYLDVTGCARVFGGLSNIVRAVIDSLARFRLSAAIAVAPTPGAAWAIASFGDNGRIVPPEDVESALSILSAAALRLDHDLCASLHHLGLETIGHVMNLPRRALPSRFGTQLLLRLDQALGRMEEPLIPLAHHVPLEARMDFEGPIESWETIWRVFQELIGRVIEQLARRGCGARRADVEFFRADKAIIRQAINFSRPTRDPVNLFNLIRCATEGVDGGDDGFLGIKLSVPLAERIDAEQIALLDHERYAGEIELAQLIERLQVRFGQDILLQPALIESHVPERAFAWQGISIRPDPPKARTANLCRPLQLLLDPREISVMVSPSDDRDGRPILFRLDGRVHELRHAVGPERIAGEWWRGHARTRDYFDVEDGEGKRFWVFRVQETNKWYVHGMF